MLVLFVFGKKEDSNEKLSVAKIVWILANPFDVAVREMLSTRSLFLAIESL